MHHARSLHRQDQFLSEFFVDGNKRTEIFLAGCLTSEEQPINIGSQVVMVLTEE